MDNYEEMLTQFEKHIKNAEDCIKQAEIQYAINKLEAAGFWLKKANSHSRIAQALIGV